MAKLLQKNIMHYILSALLEHKFDYIKKIYKKKQFSSISRKNIYKRMMCRHKLDLPNESHFISFRVGISQIPFSLKYDTNKSYSVGIHYRKFFPFIAFLTCIGHCVRKYVNPPIQTSLSGLLSILMDLIPWYTVIILLSLLFLPWLAYHKHIISLFISLSSCLSLSPSFVKQPLGNFIVSLRFFWNLQLCFDDNKCPSLVSYSNHPNVGIILKL